MLEPARKLFISDRHVRSSQPLPGTSHEGEAQNGQRRKSGTSFVTLHGSCVKPLFLFQPSHKTRRDSWDLKGFRESAKLATFRSEFSTLLFSFQHRTTTDRRLPFTMPGKATACVRSPSATDVSTKRFGGSLRGPCWYEVAIHWVTIRLHPHM
jgi:hypothetical protein